MRKLALIGAFAALLFSGAARAQCTPPNAPPNSVGCFPKIIGNAQTTDLIYLWRTSQFQAPQATVAGTVAQLLGAITDTIITNALGGNLVRSFNTRVGAIVLTSLDVTTALGFTPGVGTLTSLICGTGLSGGTITTTGTCAVLYGHASNQAVQGSDVGAASGVAPLDGSALVPLANLPASLPWVGIPLGAVSVPGANQISAKIVPFACTIPANLGTLTAPPAAAGGWAFTQSTGTVTLSLKVKHAGSDTTVGDITFSAATSAPSFPANSQTAVAAGDVVFYAFPNSPDATLADITTTIPCKKS